MRVTFHEISPPLIVLQELLLKAMREPIADRY
jgi:hypothetical protein